MFVYTHNVYVYVYVGLLDTSNKKLVMFSGFLCHRIRFCYIIKLIGHPIFKPS